MLPGGGGGRASFFPLPTLHVQKSVNFGNFTELYLCTLKTYHFLINAFGNVKATEIKIKLLLVLDIYEGLNGVVVFTFIG